MKTQHFLQDLYILTNLPFESVILVSFHNQENGFCRKTKIRISEREMESRKLNNSHKLLFQLLSLTRIRFFLKT